MEMKAFDFFLWSYVKNFMLGEVAQILNLKKQTYNNN